MKRFLSLLATISILLVIVALVVLGVSIIATLLIVLAYGLGLVYTHFLPFEIGQTTLLALIAVIAVAALVWRVVSAFISQPLSQESSPGNENEEEEDDDDEDEDEWDTEGWDEDDEPDDSIPSIPHRQQPLRPARFEGVGRNDPCPCGSGRKFKNCHGRTTRQASW